MAIPAETGLATDNFRPSHRPSALAPVPDLHLESNDVELPRWLRADSRPWQLTPGLLLLTWALLRSLV